MFLKQKTDIIYIIMGCKMSRNNPDSVQLRPATRASK